MEGHTLHPVNFLLVETLVSNLVILLVVLLFIFFNLEFLVVGHYLREYRQMRIEQLPSWLKNEIDAVF